MMRNLLIEHLEHVEHHQRLLRREAMTIEENTQVEIGTSSADVFIFSNHTWQSRELLERANELEQTSARKVDYLNYLLDNDKL
jgi:hypothetical protein